MGNQTYREIEKKTENQTDREIEKTGNRIEMAKKSEINVSKL